MNNNKRLLHFTKKIGLPAVAFTILAIMSKQLSSLFFETNSNGEMNPLGNFFFDIDEWVAWVLLIVGIGWVISSFFGKALQLRSPFFYTGLTYLTFYFWGDIYQSTPLLYLSIVLIIPLLWHLKNLQKEELTKSTESPIWMYDSIKQGKTDELYHGRKEIIEMITTEIGKMKDDEHSFAIGLEGGWGLGKSTLFRHIKENLSKEDGNGLAIETLEFSPWAFPEGKNLSIEFLFELRKILSKYSFRARFVVNSYISVLTSNYSLGAIRLIAELLFPRESLTCVKEKLNKLILFHKIKLVVFIDDLDRLDKNEIAEVFKMLRNTGDIANTIYIVAYDRLNVERFDEFCKGFLDKIINVEIDLTPFDSSILLEYLINDIKDDFKEPLFNEESGFSNILELQRYPLIIRDICNPRDIKRLKNSIKARLCLIEKINQELISSTFENEPWKYIFDKNFLIFLEIVKIKDYKLYLDIKNQRIFEDDFSNKIKKEYIATTNGSYGKKVVSKYENRYRDKLLDYLVNTTKEGEYDEKLVFIPRIALNDYFAANYDELYVANFIRSFINHDNKPEYGIVNLLESWKDKDNLFSRAIIQIKISLNEAKLKNASQNFCAFVASLVTFEEYYFKLTNEIVAFCTEYGTDEMFHFINENRSSFDYKGEIEIKNSYDCLYNDLVQINVTKPNRKNWFQTIIDSQEARFIQLVVAEKLRRADDVLCWVDVTDDSIPILSPNAVTALRECATSKPEIFFTKWAFNKIQDEIAISSNWGIKSLFNTASDLREFVRDSSLANSNPSMHQSLSVFIENWDTYPKKTHLLKPHIKPEEREFIDAVK